MNSESFHQNLSPMFGLFKKKDPQQAKLEKLQKQYKSLLDESFKLSTTDRQASDLKRAEAEAIADQIATLKKEE